MRTDAPLYPVGLRVAGSPCLVVGGGPVAGRKALGLVACAARVTLVAPDPTGALQVLEHAGPAPAPGSLRVRRRSYRPGEAASYRLVVAATGRPEVDDQVWQDAQAAEVLVNTVDDPSRCTVVLPAVHRDGPVTLSVATGGASPALAAWLRDRLAAFLGPGLGNLAQVLGEARRALHEQGRSTEQVDWRALFAGPLPALASDGRLEEARQLLAEHLGLPLASPYPPEAAQVPARRCTSTGRANQAASQPDAPIPPRPASAAANPAAGPGAWFTPR